MKEFQLLIEAGKTEQRYWRDIWSYRELFLILAWRDIAVRYKQTALGVIWAVLRPILTMVIFVIVFNKLAKLPLDSKTPYAIFVFAALLPWYFFSTALADSSGSMVTNSNLVSKVYFPRIIIPTAAVLVACVDFAISLMILALLILLHRYSIDWQILTLPFFCIILLIFTWSLGIFFAALNVRYMDFKFVIPFLIQIGLYISPIGFSSSIIPDEWRYIFYLNPLVGIIDGFRWAILDENSPLNITALAFTIAECTLMFILSVKYFRKLEKNIADTI